MAWADWFNIPRLSTSMRLPSWCWPQLHNLIETAIKVISLQDYDLLRLEIEGFYRFSAGSCIILLHTVLKSMSLLQVLFVHIIVLAHKLYLLALQCNLVYIFK